MIYTENFGNWLAGGNRPVDREQVIALRTAGTGVSANPYTASWPHEMWPGSLRIAGPNGILFVPSLQARLNFHAAVTAMLEQFDQAAVSASSNVVPFGAKDQPQIDEQAFVDVQMAQAAEAADDLLIFTDDIGDWLARGNHPVDQEQAMALRTAGTGVSASHYLATWPHEVWPGALCIEGPGGQLYLPSWESRLRFQATVTTMLELFDRVAAVASSNVLPFVAKDEPQVDEEAVVDVPLAEAA